MSASFYDALKPRSGPLNDPIAVVNDIAGVTGALPSVREDNWNDLNGSAGTRANLLDGNAIVTSVDVNWAGTDVFANFYVGALPGDAKLMNGHLVSSVLGQTGLVIVDVTGLGSAFDLSLGYDVYVYVDTEHVSSSQEIRIDDGIIGPMSAVAMDNSDDIEDSSGNFLPFDVPGDYDDATIDGIGTFVVFRGLTGPSFLLEASSMMDSPAYINGFQIAGTRAMIPEPSSVALCLLGGMALITPRKR